MTGDDVARGFATQFSEFMEWAQRDAVRSQSSGEQIAAELRERLGAGAAQSVVSKSLSPLEHVNLQAALDDWTQQPGRTVEVRGLFIPRHYGGLDLTTLITGTHGPPVQLVSPPMIDLPDGPGSTRACYRRALLLVTDDRGSYAVFVAEGEHGEDLQLEIAGLDVAAAQGVIAELDELRDRLNVYRGHIVQAHSTPMGGIRLEFLDPTPMPRDRLILPDEVLARIETHTVGIAEHREQLRAAGQHLKRGLLLFGPPGTGKTHTIRYVLGQLSGYTRLLLQGAALHAIGPAAELARRLAPSVVVLEDVDLVAQDRSFGAGDNPVLFELLDAMDGAAEDSDLLFILTTNRAEVLEHALAARPGRVDVAVEIERPDASARERLFRLYAGKAPLTLTPELVGSVVSETEGVTASFLKELVRRAVMVALEREPTSVTVRPTDVEQALRDLTDSTQAVTRSLLGSGAEPAGLTIGEPEPALADGAASFGFFSYHSEDG